MLISSPTADRPRRDPGESTLSAAIDDIALHETARERYLNYALSVITSRALPDVRDGLKPVQRRIVYAMHTNLRLVPDAKYRKSAAVVGEVMAKYHPHGDSSIYDAMVRMAQDFSLRYPLVDGQGNFGSLDGDNAAAMRYTEAKLRHLTVELIDELRKRTVEMRPNYDGTLFEPVVLPAQVPNLLINGRTGIAVGMATSIPPHHLGEVIDALCAMIDDPNVTLGDIVPSKIRGPDFPTGGEILNDAESLREIYETGRGSIELRGTWVLEEDGKRKQIVLNSIPFAINKANLIVEIADHVRQGKLPLIVDVRDESTDEVRIVLELRKGADAEAAMSYLYKRTTLLTRFHVNLTALIPTDDPQLSRPERLSLLQILRHFLDFRYDITTRRLRFDLEELERRIHILEGFEKVFDDLDEAIRLIRTSSGKDDARNRLMERFDLDWDQGEAILETKLYRLAKLEIESIRKELAEKRAEAARLRALLADDGKLWALIRGELGELRAAYDDRRRTQMTGPVETSAFSEETYIVAEDSFVIVTREGWIKRQKSYTDAASIRVREGDTVGWIVPCSTRETVVLLGDRGKAYTVRVADLPLTTGYGEFVGARYDLADGESLVAVQTSDRRVWPRQAPSFLASLAEDAPKPPYLCACTRAGRTMRIALDGYLEPSTRAGRTYLRLTDGFPGGDLVISAAISDGEELVAVVSRDGRTLLFPIADVPVLSGAGKGVGAIKLGVGDHLVAAGLVHGREGTLEVRLKGDKVEPVAASRFRPSGRGGAGRPLIRSGKVEGPVLAPVVLRFPDAVADAERQQATTKVEQVDAPVVPAAVPVSPARTDELASIFGGVRPATWSGARPGALPGILESTTRAEDAAPEPGLLPIDDAAEVASLRDPSAPPRPSGPPALRPSGGPALRPGAAPAPAPEDDATRRKRLLEMLERKKKGGRGGPDDDQGSLL